MLVQPEMENWRFPLASMPPFSAGVAKDSLRAALRGGLAFCALADAAQQTNVAITNKTPGIRFDITIRFLLLVWVTEGLADL